MDLHVGKSPNLRGVVQTPPNKSHSFRALILASLAEGTSRIVSPAVSNDWLRGIEAMEMFGARITPHAKNVWEIAGVAGTLRTPDDVIDCGNSGILLRFLAAIATGCGGYSILNGDESLRRIRLCQPLLDALNALGAWAVSTKGDGHAPVVVRGPLKGGRAEIDGLDSQPVSALLVAGALAESPVELVVRRPGEKPWVALTLSWLDRAGVRYVNENYERYRIKGGQRWKGFEAKIPLDWSAALYPIAAGVLTERSEVRLSGLDVRDSQGDKAVVDILRSMGADVEVSGREVIARSSRLQGRTIDCNDFIDQFMLLAVVGACAEGETVLMNAEVCRHKECDRIAEMAGALKAMGADVQERPDGLVVRKSRLRGASLSSRGDHRMVMTLAVAGLVADGPTVVSDVECVKKTFPDFIEQMQAAGADLEAR